MNVFLSKNAIVLALAGVLTATGGCVGSFDPQTEAASPLAPRIQELVESHDRYPRWEDFPKASTDTPTPAYVANQVQTLGQSNQTLAAQVAAIDWTLNTDPTVLENLIREKFDPAAMAPIGPQSPAEIEALAESLRRRATPPPPIDRPRF